MDLLSQEQAEADLRLLQSCTSNVPEPYTLNPKRHYGEILFNLLDYKTREEIRTNRHQEAEKEDSESSNSGEETETSEATEEKESESVQTDFDADQTKSAETPSAETTDQKKNPEGSGVSEDPVVQS